MKKLQHILMAACTVLIISTPACAQKKQTAKKTSSAKTEMTAGPKVWRWTGSWLGTRSKDRR